MGDGYEFQSYLFNLVVLFMNELEFNELNS